MQEVLIGVNIEFGDKDYCTVLKATGGGWVCI